MGRRIALLSTLLSLGACDGVFGLHSTGLWDDARPPPDGLRLLLPPDGATACSGTPIDFTSWTFDPITTPPLVVFGMTLYAVPGGQHVLMSAQAQSAAGYYYSVFDWDFVGTPAEIMSLRAPNMTALGALGLSPDGNTLWLLAANGVYYATRSSGWAKQVANLGLSDPTPDPGAVGFLDGTARMVVASNAGSVPQLIELSSPDGVNWTPVAGSISMSGSGFAAYHNPSLTPDACTLVFTGVTTGEQFELYVASRDAGGVFGSPTRVLPTNNTIAAPALSADLANLWLYSFSTTSQIYHGHP